MAVKNQVAAQQGAFLAFSGEWFSSPVVPEATSVVRVVTREGCVVLQRSAVASDSTQAWSQSFPVDAIPIQIP
jgi:hypothetical protein